MKPQKFITNLMILMIIFSSFLPIVEGTTTEFEPKIGIYEPEKYYGCYIEPDGFVRYDSITIPIISTLWEEQIIGAILFDNVSLEYMEFIESANLSLYFLGDLEATTEDLMITVYGMDAGFPPGSNLAGIDAGFPPTTNHVNINLKNITSAQWVNIDVTNIVQEIVNHLYWDSGYSMGFLFYGTPEDTARSFQSNVGVNVPKLIVNYGEPSESPEQEVFIEQYRNYTIYQDTPDYSVTIDRTNKRLLVFNSSYEVGTGIQAGVLINNSIPSEWSIRDNKYVYRIGDRVYLTITNTTGTDESSIVYTDDLGETWNILFDFYSGFTKSIMGLVYNPVFNTFHVLYVPDSGSPSRIYGRYYNLTDSTLSSAVLVRTMNGYETPVDMWMVCDSVGRVWGAIQSTISGSSTFRAQPFRIDTLGDWGYDFDLLENPYLVTSYGLDVQVVDFTYPNGTRYEALNWYWSWLDQSGTSDDLCWVYHDTTLDSLSIPNYSGGTNWVRLTNYNIIAPEKKLFTYKNFESYEAGDAIALYLNDEDGYDRINWGIQEFPYSGTPNVYDTGNFSADFDVGGIWFNGINNTFSMVIKQGTTAYYFPYIDPFPVSTPEGWARLAIDNVGLIMSQREILNEISFRVYDSNGTLIDSTCLEEAETIEEIRACIDTREGGYLPDDPYPPQWIDGSGYFTRPKVRMYLFILGWILIWLPIWALSFVHGTDRIQYIWLMLFCIVLGLGLLWSIPTV